MKVLANNLVPAINMLLYEEITSPTTEKYNDNTANLPKPQVRYMGSYLGTHNLLSILVIYYIVSCNL